MCTSECAIFHRNTVAVRPKAKNSLVIVLNHVDLNSSVQTMSNIGITELKIQHSKIEYI